MERCSSDDPKCSASAVEEVLRSDGLRNTIFDFVGGLQWLYLACVSKGWREHYQAWCNLEESRQQRTTSYSASFIIAAKLEWAFTSSAAADTARAFLWTGHRMFDAASLTRQIAAQSLEPIAVITMLKLRGDWTWADFKDLFAALARESRLSVMQWLHAQQFNWRSSSGQRHLSSAVRAGIEGGCDLSILDWLYSHTHSHPWRSLSTRALHVAGCCSNTIAAGWLRQKGAAWPASFLGELQQRGSLYRNKGCWTPAAVEWALREGSGWRGWDCSKLTAAAVAAAAQHSALCGDGPLDIWYDDFLEQPESLLIRRLHTDVQNCLDYEAACNELLAWGHSNGCPCTCGSTAAAAVVAASATAQSAAAAL
jgi:hypothetical protein